MLILDPDPWPWYFVQILFLFDGHFSVIWVVKLMITPDNPNDNNRGDKPPQRKSCINYNIVDMSLYAKCINFRLLRFKLTQQNAVKLGETNLTFVKDTKYNGNQICPNSDLENSFLLRATIQGWCFSVWPIVKRKSIFRSLWHQSLGKSRFCWNSKCTLNVGCQVAELVEEVFSDVTFLSLSSSFKALVTAGDFDNRGRGVHFDTVTDHFSTQVEK